MLLRDAPEGDDIVLTSIEVVASELEVKVGQLQRLIQQMRRAGTGGGSNGQAPE